MRKQRVAVAQNVVQHLADAERTNDLALVATARLAISMLEGRLELNARGRSPARRPSTP